MAAEKSPYHEIYLRAAGAVAFVAVETADGQPGLGSCFHIGDGIFITARHVVDDVTIKEIATTKSARLAEEAGGGTVAPRYLGIVDGPHYGDDDLDIAVFKVDLTGAALPKIAVSGHVEYDLDEHDLILSDLVIIGYPRVPMTTVPVQVATIGQINAVARLWHSRASRFIASTMARGGFSGGVALDRDGRAIALVTESLGEGGSLVETGYTSLLSISTAVDLAVEKYGFSVHGTGPGRYDREMLVGFRFQRPETQTLSSYAYDAEVFVYDDDRDVFVQFTCDSEEALEAAIAAFAAVAPLCPEEEGAPDKGIFLPAANPSARLLVAAAEAARDTLVAAGYKEFLAGRSKWQLKT